MELKVYGMPKSRKTGRIHCPKCLRELEKEVSGLYCKKCKMYYADVELSEDHHKATVKNDSLTVKGCGKWVEDWNRECGEMEDLKHSDHIIYCDDCRKLEQDELLLHKVEDDTPKEKENGK